MQARNTRRRRRVVASIHPPPFGAAVVYNKVYRFQANAAVTQIPITMTNLLDMLAVATTATTATRLCASMRLRKVSLWGPPASTLVPVTVALEFNTGAAATGLGSPSTLRSDTSVGATEPAHVVGRPPANGLAGMWFAGGGTTQLMLITGPINTIVDVEVQYVLQNGEAPVALAAAPVGATAGEVFVRALDGVAAATTQLPPLSYRTY